MEKTVKGNKGILPYEAAKILAHYSTIDNLNTEEADNELAMKSFKENEGKEALEKTGDNEYDGKELKGEVGDHLLKLTQNDNHVKTTAQPDSSVNKDSHNNFTLLYIVDHERHHLFILQ